MSIMMGGNHFLLFLYLHQCNLVPPLGCWWRTMCGPLCKGGPYFSKSLCGQNMPQIEVIVVTSQFFPVLGHWWWIPFWKPILCSLALFFPLSLTLSLSLAPNLLPKKWGPSDSALGLFSTHSTHAKVHQSTLWASAPPGSISALLLSGSTLF